jgi:hypothetical protein
LLLKYNSMKRQKNNHDTITCPLPIESQEK